MVDILKQHNFEHAEAVSIASADFSCKYNGVIFVGTGGASSILKVITIGGETVTFTGVPSGTILPIVIKTVVKTGTDTSNMMILS